MLTILALALVVSACGGSDSNSTSGPTNPAPFDSAKGEGEPSKSLTLAITTYSTGNPTSDLSDDAPANPALDAYYTDTICPSGLTQMQCMQNEQNLNTADFGNFDVTADPIANNPLGIQTVDASKIIYTAINVNGAAVMVSGGITIPDLPPRSIKGIILFFHGTTVQRSDVPSNFITGANSGGNFAGILLAALWSSQGYVVVMPDYIGLGVDTTDPHPYVVYPEVDAQSGLAMVKATRSYLSSMLPGKQPLYISGYSEGGAYALEAAHLMQDNPRYAQALDVDLKLAVPMSGVFDLTGTMLPYLFDNVSDSNNQWLLLDPTTSALSKPYLSANLALSFASYGGIAPTDIMADAFYNCPANSGICGASNNLDGLYYETDIPDTLAVIEVGGQATNTAWAINNNSVQPLLTTTYAQQLMQGDTKNPLYAQLLSADTYLFTPSFPLTLVSLAQDSVVTPVNTKTAFAYITGQNPSGPYLEFLVDNHDFLVPGLIFGTDPIDHTTEVPFLAVLALNQFKLHP
jgi:Alpha/beta hydrolase family